MECALTHRIAPEDVLDRPGADRATGDEGREYGDSEPCLGPAQQRVAIVGAQAAGGAHGDPAPVHPKAPVDDAVTGIDQALVPNEIERRLGPAMPGEIAWAAQHRRLHRRDTACNQAGILERTDADRGIEALADQVDLAIARLDVELELGMALRQFGQDRSKMVDAEGERHRQPQPPGHALRLLRNRLARLGELGQDALAARLELEPGLGSGDAARRAAEQSRAEIGLEPGYPATDDRLRQAEAMGSAPETAGVGDRDEAPDIVDLGHESVPV
jgi:hypothetical protein